MFFTPPPISSLLIGWLGFFLISRLWHFHMRALKSLTTLKSSPRKPPEMPDKNAAPHHIRGLLLSCGKPNKSYFQSLCFDC